MECKHAYTDKKIDYVLCDLEPKPNPFNRTELFHAVCAHQVHCPKAKCHRLSASWIRCVKLPERGRNEEVDYFSGQPHIFVEPAKTRSTKATEANTKE